MAVVRVVFSTAGAASNSGLSATNKPVAAVAPVIKLLLLRKSRRFILKRFIFIFPQLIFIYLVQYEDRQ